MLCPICAQMRLKTHEAVVLGRFTTSYWRCPNCAFWGTDDPTWISEAYSSAIAQADTGLVTRNLYLAERIPQLLMRLAPSSQSKFVDWAGGYGLFVRLMRDAGFHFYWQDDYADNHFAQTYEFHDPASQISAVTAFEVFEHVEDPLAFVRRVIESTGCSTIIFTTELHDETYDQTWWYLLPQTGQHISFYSRRTLEVLASRLSLTLYSNSGIHMLTSRTLHPLEYQLLLKTSRLTRPLIKRFRNSLTWQDHIAVLEASKPAIGLEASKPGIGQVTD